MKELSAFKDEGIPRISIAQAGINKIDWTSANEEDSISLAFKEMSAKRFDVLPVLNSDNEVSHFYTTTNWGKYREEEIVMKPISEAERLYYLTSIEDAVHHFATKKSNFFFIDNLSDVIGLITIGNLNCKQVYLYLYHLIVELEHKLGDLIYKSGFTDSELIEIMAQRTESKNSMDAINRYREDDSKGVDYDFIEYIYLTDLAYLLGRLDLIDQLNVSKTKFDKMIARINEIRKIVAHPNRTLVTDSESVDKLDKGITYMLFISSKLKSIINTKA